MPVPPVAFHINAADKLAYACRLVRKALRHDAHVTIAGPLPVLHVLSAQLWKQAPTDFLAHAMPGADASQLALAPVVLVENPVTSPQRDVLLNLHPQVPPGHGEFARLVEIVDTTAEDRAQARQRWRAYEAQGHAITHHDLTAPRPG